MQRDIETTLIALVLAAGATAQEWYREEVSTSPAARRFHSFEFDTARHQSLLFGGIDEKRGVVMGDTWSFDGSRWILRSTSGPTPRQRHGCCFDQRRRRLIVFGGLDGSDKALADTWSFDGRNWELLSTANAPTPRSGAGMTYDSRRGVAVLFGGRDAAGKPLGDTWEFDGEDWQVRTSAKAPAARHGHAMAYHQHRGVSLLFGGMTAGSTGSASETWLWDGADWRQVKSATTPSSMIFPAAAFNPDHGVVVLTGAVGSLNPGIATFAFDGTDWHRGPAAPGGLYGRQGHGLAFDVVRNAAVLFGGASITRGGAIPRDDTWELSVQAQAEPFGRGCSTGLGELRLAAGSRPAIGTRFALSLGQVPAMSIPLLVLGASNRLYAGQNLPLPVRRAQGPGCQLLVSVDVVIPMELSGHYRFDVPLDPDLLGLALFGQGFVLGSDPALSNGLKLVLGN